MEEFVVDLRRLATRLQCLGASGTITLLGKVRVSALAPSPSFQPLTPHLVPLTADPPTGIIALLGKVRLSTFHLQSPNHSEP